MASASRHAHAFAREQDRTHARASAAIVETHSASPRVDPWRTTSVRRVFYDRRAQRGVQGIEDQNPQSIAANLPVVGARFKRQVNEIKDLRGQL